ncbi:MAG: hypothetical protein AB1816_02890 [Bacillota bacterium]
MRLLDRLARWHGSRAQAVRFLLRAIGGPYVELRSEIAGVRQEVAGLREDMAALRAVVERSDRVEIAARREEEARPGDDEAVKQVLGALLSMSRTARVE